MAGKGKPAVPDIHPGLTGCLQRHLPCAQALRQPLRDVPGLELYLLNPDFPQRGLTPDQVASVLNYPAYWAFCWASGQVLARWILEHPESVAGKRVLDFGSGSGVVGIAAAIAGATEVLACDLDPDARYATAINAELSGVHIELCAELSDCEGELDLILAADVLYDRANLPWLDCFLDSATRVVLADSRLRQFSHSGYQRLGQWQSSTWPDLDESPEFRTVSVYASSRTSG